MNVSELVTQNSDEHSVKSHSVFDLGLLNLVKLKILVWIFTNDWSVEPSAEQGILVAVESFAPVAAYFIRRVYGDVEEGFLRRQLDSDGAHFLWIPQQFVGYRQAANVRPTEDVEGAS